jgi:hypothetical protein
MNIVKLKRRNKLMNEPRYWIGVVSQSHVARGEAGGFAQLCHGKAGPLKRMQTGDWLVYYSPRTDMRDGESLQAFTAIGRVASDDIYEVRMTEDFTPFRRNVHYVSSQPASIHRLLDRLTFITDKQHWGFLFRRGHFAVSQEDFLLIASAMGVNIEKQEARDGEESKKQEAVL